MYLAKTEGVRVVTNKLGIKKQKNKKLLKSIECLTNKKTCNIEITKIVTQT